MSMGLARIEEMTFRKKVFVSQKISLLVAEKEFRVQALVSAYGAKYVFEDSELPQEIREMIGKEIELVYRKVPVKCRVVREVNSAGIVYSFRFIRPSNVLLKQIEKDIQDSGLPSPWLRSLPRLSTEAKHLPLPALAVVDYGGDVQFLSVKNFTLGGLLVEYTGNALRDLVIGRTLTFDLVTNGGDKIDNLTAKVTHLSTETVEKNPEANRVQFGLKFLPMNLLSDAKYKALIRSHCMGLKFQPMEAE
jgi:hypothetical protein